MVAGQTAVSREKVNPNPEEFSASEQAPPVDFAENVACERGLTRGPELVSVPP